jgi:antitoxin HicB
MKKKTLNEYLDLNYPIELVADEEEGGYVASHPDLEGCFAQGGTADEAVMSLTKARDLWIRTRFEDGLSIPEPLPEDPSGRILLRVSAHLHSRALRVARQQGVSLNHLIATALAEYVGGAQACASVSNVVERLEGLVRHAQAWPAQSRVVSIVDTTQGLGLVPGITIGPISTGFAVAYAEVRSNIQTFFGEVANSPFPTGAVPPLIRDTQVQ